MFNRRLIPFTLAAACTAVMVQAQPASDADWIVSVLRSSMETKKGVTLHVHGQAIPLIVTAMNDRFVEGRNQQSSRVVVRIASIDAAIA